MNDAHFLCCYCSLDMSIVGHKLPVVMETCDIWHMAFSCCDLCHFTPQHPFGCSAAPWCESRLVWPYSITAAHPLQLNTGLCRLYGHVPAISFAALFFIYLSVSVPLSICLTSIPTAYVWCLVPANCSSRVRFSSSVSFSPSQEGLFLALANVSIIITVSVLHVHLLCPPMVPYSRFWWC